MSDNEEKKSPQLSSLRNAVVTNQDRAIEELERALEQEKDRRCEDRFIALVIIVVLLDVVFFTAMDNFGGPIAILVLELLILIPLANRMGMDEIAKILNKIIDRAASGVSNGS